MSEHLRPKGRGGSLFMKPGRSPEEIKQWLLLLSFISGIMTIGFGISIFATNF